MKTLARVAALQAAWWATVLLAGAGHARWAVLPQLAFVGLAVALDREQRRARAAIAMASALCGLVADGALLASGALSFPTSPPLSWSFVPPPFMLAMWAAFGVALPALRLRTPTLVGAAVVGAVAGPLAYRAGAAFGAIALSPGALVPLAIVWAIALPLLVVLARALPPRLAKTPR